MQKGFIGLALRNQELLELNKKLNQRLEIVIEELNQINQERLSKRDPMTGEIYKELIQAAEGPTYIHVRTRVALCILAVTGIRINELLPLKVN